VEYCEQRDWHVLDVLQTAVESQLKVSFGWDNYHDCVLLSITPKKTEHTFYGYVVSVRHQDIETLFKVLFWLCATSFNEVDEPVGKNGKYDW